MTTTDDIDEILSVVRSALENAYERGRSVGAQEMRDRIVNAASSGLVTQAPAPAPAMTAATVPEISATSNRQRLPNGTVRPVVSRILARAPRIATGEVVRLAQAEMPGLSTTAVTNELNRQKGKTYANQDGLWSLIHTEGPNGQRYPRPTGHPHNADGPADEARPSEVNGAAVQPA